MGQICYAEGLSIYTEADGKLQYIDESGKLTGLAVEVVQEIQRRVGDSTGIKMVTWAIGYKKAQEDSNTVLFSTAKTPERESLFKWVGPIFRSRYIFYAKKDSNIKIESLKDAKKVKAIGAVSEDFREQMLKNEGFTNLNTVKDNVINVKRLMSGKIDLVVLPNLLYADIVKDAGFSPDDLKEAFEITKTQLYIAFSKTTDDLIVGKWNKAFNDMKKDGTLQKIISKFIPTEKF